jgi:hypothetical protein
MIRDVHPGSGSRIRILIFHPSRMHPIPAPDELRNPFLNNLFLIKPSYALRYIRAQEKHRWLSAGLQNMTPDLREELNDGLLCLL